MVMWREPRMVLILPKAVCSASLTLMGKTDVGEKIIFPDKVPLGAEQK